MKPRDEVLDRTVSLRLTQKDYEQAVRAAKADGRPLSNWLARLIARELAKDVKP